MSDGFWRGRRVLLTGHTGFKGSWLSLWLHAQGAEVHGYALVPPASPNLFTVAGVAGALASSTLADIRDLTTLTALCREVRPQIVFHLAAQALVRQSYREPVDTFATNVMGVVNLLEAVRSTGGVRAVVNVTTDKCYENREWPWAYREIEPMGGHDPYSASKGCAELVTAAYRASFLKEAGVAVATARAGNVIGGGDWAEDRLLPDIFRALDARRTLPVRSPHAVRPWQHVLEPLSGYLALAEALAGGNGDFAEAWNFGPADDDARDVAWIVGRLASRLPDLVWQVDAAPQPHEAHYLKLDSSKARSRLGWQPRWRLAEALDRTLQWHQAWRAGADMRAVCLAQIADHVASADADRS
ncbi:MAG: CDP-glucose 4,6-dehydratase [Methyloversatilis sp.]|nr:CDP-glucose 4,6-dehydratase [Methyloversatilis sp.]